MARPALQRCPQCQCLHPGVRHLLCGELWIRQDDPTADRRAQVRNRVSACSLISDDIALSTRHADDAQFCSDKNAQLHICDRVTVTDHRPAATLYNPAPPSRLPPTPPLLGNDIWFRHSGTEASFWHYSLDFAFNVCICLYIFAICLHSISIKSIYVCMYICVYLCMCMYMCICVCLCIHVCVNVYMNIILDIYCNLWNHL